MVNTKKGISLIVLVITIIVIIILAVAVILTIANNNPIGNAKKAVENWNDAEEKERLAILNHELLMLKSDKNKTINDALVLLHENTKLVDNSDYRENTYIVDGTDSAKKYIFDEDWALTEATDIITIFEAVKEYINEQTSTSDAGKDIYTMKGIKGDLSASDEALKEILGDLANIYDNTKFRLAIIPYRVSKGAGLSGTKKSGRLLCYPDQDIPIENVQKCEKLGIYLYGDVNGDLIVQDDDADYLSNNVTKVNRTDKTKRQWIVSDVSTTTTPAINATDSKALMGFIITCYANQLEKLQLECSTTIEEKVTEGISKENIEAKTTEAIKEYIPSYNKGWYSFRLEILRGNLFGIKSGSSESSYKIGAYEENGISILGDLTEDYDITTEDKDKLLNYINSSEELSESQLLVADTNGDGQITLEDVQLIQDMINGAY